MRNLITSGLAVLAAAGIMAGTGTAQAATTPVTASTHLTGRPDSGGNGNWATDAMTRTLAITSLGGGSYTATVTDSGGTFTTIMGAYVPNQGANPGGRFASRRHSGTFTGTASFSFTASKAPSASLVPASESGAPAAGSDQTTSLWYEQAFPAGTVFGGTGILGSWSWSYTAVDACDSPVRGFFTVSQRWTDAAVNGGGQLPGDGQVQDLAPSACPA